MKSVTNLQFQQLIQMLNAFVTGENRSRDFVSKLEGQFADCLLDNDERFIDLQLALAMFGAADHDADVKMLLSEARYALKILQNEL